MQTVYDKEPFPTDTVQFVQRGAESGVWHITWQRWACGALPVVRCFLGQSRSPHAIPAWPARTALQMPHSDELLLLRVPQWRCTYKLKHCLSDILLRHSLILQLRSVVIFDNFVVLVARFFWFFRILAYYYVINLIGVYNDWVYCVGLGARSVVIFCQGASVCGGPRYSTQGIPWKCH